jgi:hypothetical protein
MILVCLSLNVALVKPPPCTNLWQHAQSPHWITHIIGVFTLISISMNNLEYAQYGETTTMN